MREFTQAEANQFSQAMCRHFHATMLHKQNAFEMEIVATAMDILRRFGAQLPDRETFLNRFATTIGGLIYMPDGWTPWKQIEVLTHELQHVHQFFKHGLGLPGGPGMWWLYISSPEARSRYEAEAMRAQVEVIFAVTGEVPTLERLLEPLAESYALDQNAITLAGDLLEISCTSVKDGIVSTEAGKQAIEWLKKNGGLSP